MIDAQRIFVTGGAGFIGSHLCERLLATTAAEIWTVDNFDPFYERAVKERNLASYRDDPRIRFRELDLRDVPATAAVYREAKPDLVIHLAAKAGVRPSLEDPAGYAEANVTVTANLLQLAAELDTRGFLFVSSSSVYGDNTPVPFPEDARIDEPVSPYAATKRAAELLASTFQRLYGMRLACARLFTVYGPRQRPDLAIHKFTRRILADEPITLFGDGTTSRDYTFIDDILDGLTACAAWLLDRPEPVFDLFNLGNSDPVSLRDLVTAIEKATGKKATIEWAPMQPGDVVRTCASTERARTAFGYEPKVDLSAGLERFVAWHRQLSAAS